MSQRETAPRPPFPVPVFVNDEAGLIEILDAQGVPVLTMWAANGEERARYIAAAINVYAPREHVVCPDCGHVACAPFCKRSRGGSPSVEGVGESQPEIASASAVGAPPRESGEPRTEMLTMVAMRQRPCARCAQTKPTRVYAGDTFLCEPCVSEIVRDYGLMNEAEMVREAASPRRRDNENRFVGGPEYPPSPWLGSCGKCGAAKQALCPQCARANVRATDVDT